jgi:hypothetical protein
MAPGSYAPPLPPLQEPVTPPSTEAAEGIPRFARDVVEEEQPVEPLVFEKALETGVAMPGVAEAAAPPEAFGSAEAAVSPEPGEEKKDLRQRLRDFLKRIRDRLEQRRSEEMPEAPTETQPPLRQTKLPKKPQTGREQERPTSAAAAEQPSGSRTQSVIGYLEELGEYIPDRRKSFLRSDARLKIEYIKSKLQGRSGIKHQIEDRFPPGRIDSYTGTAGSTTAGTPLDAVKIAETFDFMKNLASYHPDKTLGTMLQSKLNAVLHKLRK